MGKPIFIFIVSFLILHVLIISSCTTKIKNSKNFEIKDFNPFVNFEYSNDTLVLPMDLSKKIISGITIPSSNQSDGGFFKFSFKVKNNLKEAKKYSFRLFYQNESYKMNEYIIKNNIKQYNDLSSNNFYGSWGYGDDTMHLTQLIPADKNWHTVIDSFKITGNPRNEKKYFGGIKKKYKKG